MKMDWRKALFVAGLAAAVAVPFSAMADSVNLNVDLGADDAAHFNFNNQNHHPELWKAARELQNAKHRIWKARQHTNFGGHGESSIQAINAALDEIRAAENFARNHGGW